MIQPMSEKHMFSGYGWMRGHFTNFAWLMLSEKP